MAANAFANAFIGQATAPTDAELTAALGQARPLWDRLVATLTREHGVATHEWHCYSRQAGWSLRLKRGERTIVYLAPAAGAFRASFALGEAARAAARASELPPPVLTILAEAKKYAEGYAVRVEVAGAKDVAAVARLAAIKIAS
ncbi:MAG TPA: DUF3788 family protein [Polyangia bacterium]|jgi:hypothetical protein